jgi:hypothetical protein
MRVCSGSRADRCRHSRRRRIRRPGMTEYTAPAHRSLRRTSHAVRTNHRSLRSHRRRTRARRSPPDKALRNTHQCHMTRLTSTRHRSRRSHLIRTHDPHRLARNSASGSTPHPRHSTRLRRTRPGIRSARCRCRSRSGCSRHSSPTGMRDPGRMRAPRSPGSSPRRTLRTGRPAPADRAGCSHRRRSPPGRCSRCGRWGSTRCRLRRARAECPRAGCFRAAL